MNTGAKRPMSTETDDPMKRNNGHPSKHLRAVDLAMITSLSQAISHITKYRINPHRSNADFWRLYGQLTCVWGELNDYLNKDMGEDSGNG